MKIQQIGAFEAKTRLSELLEKVQRGQVFHITRRGQPVAVLSGIEPKDGAAPRRNDSLVSRCRALRARSKRGPETLKQLVDWGRR
ncbi:MAG TPA: type II toxin-antitoxin system prevent-host-death family antitoxin [Verrucomicrobiae bacterium]|nr:type II toxin-antitoxin system prevent-host-death family antitoxin [Verrucomicrobiae bacterium]